MSQQTLLSSGIGCYSLAPSPRPAGLVRLKWRENVMGKNTRKVNKANHGKRPASSLARKAKRRKMGV